MNPKISIICPVYNAEKYIRKCIDSIIAQMFTDWELILVDDGAKDSSAAICDEYTAKDSRIRVIHKENGGVSSARQVGLDAVSGDYVIHVDPDDWVESDMLSELSNKALSENADMVICDFYTDINGCSSVKKQHLTSLKANDVLNDMFLDNIHGSCCNKLVKRECIALCNAKFPIGVNYCEDVCFNVQLLKHDIKIAYLSKCFYHYVQYNTSLTNHYTLDTLNTQKKYIEVLCNLLPEDSLPVVRSKILVKKLAFRNRILTEKEFNQLYPEITYTYDSKPILRLMYKLAFTGHHLFAEILLYIYKKRTKI